ncbi:thiol:disulfide interchange protein TlpA [Mangrovibrevibacter kandeliae]|uniref:thiol:disulfide interchange protein TlpA n=1 Tax=Mangrovibrevibacter kandeliae TaxID=2968473 RepID=UPI0021191E5E|nr:TlpA disulfide reductase family protein [Aurantimonas sp. CSK15Z-1]MCQ8783828.1 TlpA family protein disulfide reductase [Aurantimonas sp. CSK15Z-1]
MAERQADTRFSLRTIAVLAVLAGLVAGAVGVYVIESRSGNESLRSAGCPADDALKQALDARASGEVAAVRPLDAPLDVSDLSFTDEDGKPKSLAAFKGKALLVNLWATWCVPCREEMPALDALERQEGGDGFQVVPISIDLGDGTKPKAFYADNAISALPLLLDPSLGSFNRLKSAGIALGLPTSLLVDAQGCARAAINGPAAWASPDAIGLVDVLKGKPAGA